MASAPDTVIVKFVLYEKECSIDVQRESEQFDDIIFVQGGTTTDYRSIVYKTFAFVQVQAAQCLAPLPQPVKIASFSFVVSMYTITIKAL